MEFREIKPKKEEVKDAEAPHYPRLHLPLEVIPEAEGWKNGETYEVTLRLKQRSIMRSEDEKGKSGSVDFNIVALKAGSNSVNSDKEKEEKSEGSYMVRE